MDLSRLRHLSDEAARQKAEEENRARLESAARSQQGRDRQLEEEWAKARAAVAELRQKVEKAARSGSRSTRVYFAYRNEFLRIYSSSWSGKSKHNVPDYAQFVYDQCKREGLRPTWKVDEGFRVPALGGGGGRDMSIELYVSR